MCIPPDKETHFLRDLLRSHRRGSPTVFLCEASVQNDLERTVTESIASGRRILWIGSGGLALALASEKFPLIKREPSISAEGIVFFFVGSDHPVTQRQLQLLRSSCFSNAVIVPVSRGNQNTNKIRAAIEHIPRHQIRCLFMTGGDTAMSVCRALAVEALIVDSEVAPGVPLTRMSGGILDGVDAVLKSGGFGQPDLFCHIAQQYNAVSHTKEGVA